MMNHTLMSGGCMVFCMVLCVLLLVALVLSIMALWKYLFRSK